ncbi:MAG: porin family protein [Verrucomicrobia bacterium]|nr:porin family protein [Verrucomicrobiota bacterium]
MRNLIIFSASLCFFAAVNADEVAAIESEVAVVEAQQVALAEGEIAASCEKPAPKPKCQKPKPKPKPKPTCEEKPVCEMRCEPVRKGHVYTSFRSGVNFLHAQEQNEIEIQPKVGYSLAGAVGYRWRNNLAVEGEFVYRYNGVTTVEFLENETIACGKVFSYNGYVNGYYHIAPWAFGRCKVTPYFGGGVGYGHQKANACPYEFHNHGKKGGFIWQVMAGFEQRLFDHFELGVEYRFSAGPQSLGFLYHQTANFTFTYLF